MITRDEIELKPLVAQKEGQVKSRVVRTPKAGLFGATGHEEGSQQVVDDSAVMPVPGIHLWR